MIQEFFIFLFQLFSLSGTLFSKGLFQQGIFLFQLPESLLKFFYGRLFLFHSKKEMKDQWEIAACMLIGSALAVNLHVDEPGIVEDVVKLFNILNYPVSFLFIQVSKIIT